MENKTEFCSCSAEEARALDILPKWRESFHANIDCARAIEDAIQRNFDGMNLSENCLAEVLEQFGYRRTEYVLANTLQELSYDGRFSR